MVDVKPFIEHHNIEIPKNTLVFLESVRKLCPLRYKTNRKGCPNYGKSEKCPPNSPYLEDEVMGKYNKFVLAYTHFDFRGYKEEMRKLHPEWTETQLGNLLYWQSSVRLNLKQYIEDNFVGKDEFFLLTCGSGKNFWKENFSMESVGIHVFKTLKNNNIQIDRNPQEFILLVCLLCYE